MSRLNRSKSTVVKHAVTLAGRRTSVSLEDAFWRSLKEIASGRGMSRSELIATISERRHANLSSAIRLFVLDFYRQQMPVRKRPDTAKT